MSKEVLTIERLEGESSRAYAARVEYVTMGAQRSLEKLSQKSTKNIQLFKRWSGQYDWVECARKYDEQVAFLTAQEAADQYRADLADYRKRYGEMGKALFGAAAKLLTRIHKAASTMKVSAASLTLVTNAAKTAADLEALALRVEHVLGQLDNDEPRTE